MRPRPMSAKRSVEMSEVDSIAAAFAKKGMTMPFSKETLENALLIPEDTPYEIAIRNMPLPGSRLISDPFAKERMAIYGVKSGKKKREKKGEKERKEKKEEITAVISVICIQVFIFSCT